MPTVTTAETGLLTPHMPRLVLRWLNEEPERTARSIDGTVVFVDISGFTALSERLARNGRVGAEEITEILGQLFTRLLAVAYGNGGMLIKFGGDALLLLFEGDDHARRGARAAYGMRRELRAVGSVSSSAGSVRLRMSVGIHSGRFDVFLVGSSHRELMMTGPAVSTAVQMEGTAGAGQIVVSRATAEHLPPGSVGQPIGAGLLLRSEPPANVVQEPGPPPPPPGDLVLSCVPLAVRRSLLAGQIEPEHRPVTVAFIHFDGTDAAIVEHGIEAMAADLLSLIGQTQALADKNGVSFLSSDIDHDGGKLILVAGAPDMLGDDEERMLVTVRALLDQPLPMPVRIGVNAGHVFAGEVGPHYRRTYTVMGDTVNLAARLMARAEPGQAIVAPHVVEASPVAFRIRPLEPFHVKGKKAPVRAVALEGVLGRREAASIDLPIVGRLDELATAAGRLSAAAKGDGGVLEIVGDAGIGKSRMLDEVRSLAGTFAVRSAACELYDRLTPYAALRPLLRSLLDLGADADASQLAHVVNLAAPELVAWLPLIGAPLDIETEPTPEVDRMSESFRRAKLNEVMVQLLERVVARPTLLLIEDVHWMDEASASLLERICRTAATRPWMIAVTRRDADSGFVAPPGPSADMIRLSPLGAGEATALVEAAAGAAPLRPHEAAAVAARSGGNPLFLRELVRATQLGEPVDELPPTVEGIVAAQIDTLDPADRTLLRYASVLGMSFDIGLFDAIVEQRGGRRDAAAWSRLAPFVTVDGDTCRFRHALIRDAAYNGLSYTRRRALHGTAGLILEGSEDGRTDERATVLSMHYFHAGLFELAWKHGTRAAENACARYANVEAAGLYERALASAGRMPGNPPLRQLRAAHETLARIYERLGEYDRAMDELAAVRRLTGGDPLLEASAHLHEAWVRERAGRYPDALRRISRGLRRLEQASGRRAAQLRAELLVARAGIRTEQGRHREAIASARPALDDARSTRATRALAYLVMGWAAMELGRPVAAAHTTSALRLYRQIGDLTGQSLALNNLGSSAYYEGRWEDAIDLWHRAQAGMEATGDMVNAAFAANNCGEVLSDQGRVIEAEDQLREALRVWQSCGFGQGVPFAIGNLGRLAGRAGDDELAVSLLTDARAAFNAEHSHFMTLEMDARLAEAAVLGGRFEEAIERADTLLSGLGPAPIGAVHQPLVVRQRAYGLMARGDLDAAAGDLDTALGAARSARMPFEIALTREAELRLAGLLGEERPAAAAELAELLRSLDILRLPEIPLQPAGERSRSVSGARSSDR
jgi:class 3 adenylate cyclase/tetratricopeptide (TPR) repeat protein